MSSGVYQKGCVFCVVISVLRVGKNVTKLAETQGMKILEDFQ